MLNNRQLEEIYRLVDFHISNIAWKVFGFDVLTKKQQEILTFSGLDIERLKSHIPSYYQSWMFGLLTAKLSDYQAKKITYKDFMGYLDKGQYKAPSKFEVAQYEIARNRSYKHLTGLGGKISESIISSIDSNTLSSSMTVQDVVGESIKQGILDRRAVTGIAKDIGNKLGDWTKDWDRIVQTEYQSIFNLGRIQTYMKEGDGVEQKVYFDVYPGACRECIRLFLTAGIGSEPKIFTLKELIENGSNYGRKRTDWLPTVITAIHAFCRCNVRMYHDGYEWDSITRSYIEPKEYKRKTAPDAKVKVKVGDKEFLV